MNKLTLILSLLVFSHCTLAENINFQSLLKQAQEGRSSDRNINAERLVDFKKNKAQQAHLLQKAKTAFARQEQRTKALEKTFESNDVALSELETQLRSQQGRLKELLGTVQQLTDDTLGQFENSIISAQFPDRVKKLSTLQEKMSDTHNSISISDIRSIWYEVLREIIESGKSVSFLASVTNASGEKLAQTVTRIGVFNAFIAGDNPAYLIYNSENDGGLTELISQPQSSYLSTAS